MKNRSSTSEYSLFLLNEQETTCPDELAGFLSDFSLQVGTALDDAGMLDADLILVYAPRAEFGLGALEALRSRPALFAKPVGLVCYTHRDPVGRLADVEILLPAAPEFFRQQLETLCAIARKARTLAEPEETEDEVMAKNLTLLRFLYCRPDSGLGPAVDTRSPVGYSHPLAGLLFQAATPAEMDMLDELEDARLIKAGLVDRIHLCPKCDHYQINFREICPSCRSLNFRDEPAVHHYSCGCVGPERDFTRGTALICPKCSKELRHIGVDYDRPTAQLWCEECGANFLEALVQCYCLACGETFPPEEAVVRLIKSYTLTPEGRTAAEKGTLPSFGLMELLRKEIGLYRPEIFRELYRLETACCKRYPGYRSTMIQFSSNALKEAFAKSGLRWTRELRKELAELFRSSFRTTDILTLLNDDDFAVILTHTGTDRAQAVVDRIDKVVHSLFKVDFDLRFEVQDLSEVEPEPVAASAPRGMR